MAYFVMSNRVLILFFLSLLECENIFAVCGSGLVLGRRLCVMPHYTELCQLFLSRSPQYQNTITIISSFNTRLRPLSCLQN